MLYLYTNIGNEKVKADGPTGIGNEMMKASGGSDKGI